MAIDYCFNRIPFTMRHFPFSIAILLVYGVINMTKTLISGKPVYDPLTFKDIWTLIWAVVLLVLALIGYLFLTWSTSKKLEKIRKIQNKRSNSKV